MDKHGAGDGASAKGNPGSSRNTTSPLSSSTQRGNHHQQHGPSPPPQQQQQQQQQLHRKPYSDARGGYSRPGHSHMPPNPQGFVPPAQGNGHNAAGGLSRQHKISPVPSNLSPRPAAPSMQGVTMPPQAQYGYQPHLAPHMHQSVMIGQGGLPMIPPMMQPPRYPSHLPTGMAYYHSQPQQG